MIVQVPELFQQKHPFPYPKNNKICFEEWFFENYDPYQNPDGRVYLPIFWTGFLVRANYGKNQPLVGILQYFLDQLPKNAKYFTIVQYDDGVIADLSGLDIKVYAMSGPRIDYCIPLIYQIPTISFTSNRDFFCNFIGRVTHPVRRDLLSFKHLNKPDKKYYISDVDHGQNPFYQILARSVFTLAPRGYGQTSFRIMEAVAQGSIPVYISDEFLIPHGHAFEDYGVLVKEKDSLYIPEILDSFSQHDIETKQGRLKDIYYSLFTYEANRDLILTDLKNSN